MLESTNRRRSTVSETYEPYKPIGKNMVRVNGVRLWLPTGHMPRGYDLFAPLPFDKRYAA